MLWRESTVRAPRGTLGRPRRPGPPPGPVYLQAGEDEKPAIVAEPVPDLFASRVCSFCKKAAEHLFGEQYPKTDRNFAIIDGVWICDECVARFARLLAQEDPGFLAQESPGTPS